MRPSSTKINRKTHEESLHPRGPESFFSEEIMVGTILLILASISFIVVIGGAVYEHVAVVPIWASAVPASLAMLQPPYGLAAAKFWIPIHPITFILLVAALLLNWRTPRRNFILLALGGYVLVLIATFLFFVPELLAITQSPFSQDIDPVLTQRAQYWETLSLVRLAILFLLAFTLLWGLSRSASRAGRGST